MAVEARADLLETIVAATRRIVEVREQRESREVLEGRCAATKPRGDLFLAGLARADRINVIAECKRRSPSRGVIRADYDPVSIARQYADAGAAAISVLTEPTFFDGALEHLVHVRQAVSVPLLRKDFIVSEYQVLEAAAGGADAVLLIVAALDDASLKRLFELASSVGLACLVEVHDEEELQRAVQAGARIVGVNNRNLRTLETDTAVARRLIAMMPAGVVSVAESGLRTPADLRELRADGYHAFLIGETLMKHTNPGTRLTQLLDRG